MEAPTAKRGVYPLHGYKLGLYRLPIKLDDPAEITSVHDGLKKTFEMDMYADRIYATYRWVEETTGSEYKRADLSVTVEIVTGEVVDIIYQIFPIEHFGDSQWVEEYRKKADHIHVHLECFFQTIMNRSNLCRIIKFYRETIQTEFIAM